MIPGALVSPLWQGDTDTDTALDELDRSLSLHDQVGSPAGMAYSLSRRAVLYTLGNAIDLGWQSVQKGIEEAERASIRDHCLQRLYGTGIWNRLQAGDHARVTELVELSEALLEAEGPCTACSLDLYPWLALHYLDQGDVDRAAACADSLTRLAGKTGNPVGEAFAAIVSCGVAGARDDTQLYRKAREQAVTMMEKAASRGSGSPMTWLFDRLAAIA